MTTSEEILIIANQLANAGKKPTLALVKTKLSQPAPLALLINTLKNWQHQPENINLNRDTEIKASSTLVATNNITQLIADAIDPLQQEIVQLKQRITKLESKIDKIK
ncbi:hypothetical protein [Thalassotalea piscium]|uniref:KfrA N-terminal DNA-binding domain-containing protein n=1 Tax=Thalassotalea piscium TaxID=1230533 RepID=A0A7X0NIK2_9GAMM|nr:hypothetical protein [Thalassotalea piscium]MBB6544117.1 hypothetical protein [Thalassotalea piscium]